MQLTIEGINGVKSFNFGDTEFFQVKKMDGFNKGKEITIFVSKGVKSIFFLSEEERDSRLKSLNKIYGTDKFGNNLKGYFPEGIFILEDGDIEKTFGSHIIFGIGLCSQTKEIMLLKAKEKRIFLQKTYKKTLTAIVK